MDGAGWDRVGRLRVVPYDRLLTDHHHSSFVDTQMTLYILVILDRSFTLSVGSS